MNPFEKILERLEESFFNLTFQMNERNKGFNYGIYKAKEIVQEVEKEYNNGWIPCSKELPPQQKENPVFEEKALELYLVTTKYGSNEQDKIYPFRAFWNGVNFTDGWNILDVIAWKPLPEPYQPNGE